MLLNLSDNYFLFSRILFLTFHLTCCNACTCFFGTLLLLSLTTPAMMMGHPPTHPHTPCSFFPYLSRWKWWIVIQKWKAKSSTDQRWNFACWYLNCILLKLSSRKVTTHNVYLGGFLKRCPWGIQLRTLERKSFKEEKAASVGFFLDYKTRTRISPKVLNVSGWKLFCQHRVPTTSLI